MTFANPLGLLGLLTLPVILVLHLFRERQRRMVVASLDLWKFLKPEVHGTRPRRIPLTWLLVLDLLVAAVISLALAQPHLSLVLPGHKARHIVLLLDVSTSMRASDAQPSRLAQAKNEANQLLAGLGGGDMATLITFGSQARLVSDSRQDSYAAMSAKVAALDVGETGHALEEALALGLASLDGKLPAEFHILSDKAFPDPGLVAFIHPLVWHIFGENAGNQAVLGISAAEMADGRIQVFARLANFSSKDVTRVVSLLADDHLVTSTTLLIPAGSAVPQVWLLEPGAVSATVLLTGGDALPEDDTAVTGLAVGSKARVTLVADQPAPLQQAVAAVQTADLQVVKPADYSPVALADLTIFRGALPAVWPEGTVLLVEPTGAPDGSAAQAFVVQDKADFPANAPVQVKENSLLAGIDFSGVRWGSAWKLAALPQGFETLVAVSDAQGQTIPVLLSGYSGGTHLLVLLADLGSGNFTKHPAFPLLINNIVESVRRAPLPTTLLTGQVINLPPAGEYHAIHLGLPGAAQTVDVTGTELWTQTLQPGAYSLALEDLAGRQITQVVGVNAGDEIESDLAPRDWALSTSTAPAIDNVAAAQPVDLLPWLLGLAGLCLFVEAVLAWR